MSTHCCAANT